MIKQNWTLGTEEKIRILNLHESATKKMYLLFEQSQESEIFSVDFGTEFKSGDFNLNPQLQKNITDKVEQISNFIKNKNLKNYKIVISPGESQVTNQPPFQKVGSLAEKRGELLKAYITPILTKLLGATPQITISEPEIGKTEWDANKDNKDNPKYKAEQFVKVKIILTSEPNYKKESNLGQPIYYNNYLFGYISEPFAKTSDTKNAGIQNIGYQDLIFTEIQKDTLPTKIIAQYKVPWNWWNQRGITKSITDDDLKTIRSFEKL